MNNEILVEIAYALPKQQLILELMVPEGTTAEQAVQQSGMLAKFPDIDLAQNKLGIFGKLVKGDTVLRERDRVEIYRPLIADPKEEYGATLTPNAWVGGPMMKIVAEFEQSMKRYPPIAPGTADPYRPPAPGKG